MIVNTNHPEPQRQTVPASGHGPFPPAPFQSSDLRLRTSDLAPRTSALPRLHPHRAADGHRHHGDLAAIALPSIRGMKPNAKVAGTRAVARRRGPRPPARPQPAHHRLYGLPVHQLLDRLRNMALRRGPSTDKAAATNLLDKQLVGYAYVSLRSVGDQPGVHIPRYLSSWKTLPQGAFIPAGKIHCPARHSR